MSGETWNALFKNWPRMIRDATSIPSKAMTTCPAHIKASLLGNSLSIPIGNGELLLGTWQGIYLGEHRNDAGSRTIVATLSGKTRP
jgi:secondary thiamine-phosphate synthase enzyme